MKGEGDSASVSRVHLMYKALCGLTQSFQTSVIQIKL
jgi:hypothetical protein